LALTSPYLIDKRYVVTTSECAAGDFNTAFATGPARPHGIGM
jgi:hypothetical protein